MENKGKVKAGKGCFVDLENDVGYITKPRAGVAGSSTPVMREGEALENFGVNGLSGR